MSTLDWVVGRGGLLGSGVERVLREGRALHWHPETPLPWGEPAIDEALAAAAATFVARAAATADAWRLFWCAGAGVVGSAPFALEREVSSFRAFLESLGAALTKEPRMRDRSGSVFLASSAGGVYGGNRERPLTESTAARPLSGYGRAKLRQEEALAAWSVGRPRVSTLVGRLSNLYGPGQRLDKPQGLVSHMSRCLIHNVPVHVYVSLDTIRDYLFADDAAVRIAQGMARLERETQSGVLHILKIFASERETTIAGIVGVFRRMTRRPLRVISGLHPARAEQPARLQFRSAVWTDAPDGHTTLREGIGQVYRHQLALYQLGRLPAPPRLALLAATR